MPLPAPDLSWHEWVFLALFAGTLIFVSSLGPEVGGLGSLWPVFAAAETP
jgi:hypothetical protein